MAPLNVPLTRTALVKKAPGQAVITTQPMPVLKPGYMLVQTKAVALNPADAGDIDYDVDPSSPSTTKLSVSQRRYEGCVIGLDYAGIVVSIEPKSPADEDSSTHSKSFSPGDRVCGSAYGCNALSPDEGGFADYIVVSTNLQMHIPEHMSFEDAASLGVGALSAGMGLFQVSKLGIPPHIWNAVSDDSDQSKSDINNKKWILVYGGSTATGSIAIQFAKLAGYRVVTTCSPRNFDLVKRVGADAFFDYNIPDVSSLIKSVTSDTLRFVFDTVATDQTAAICVNALSSSTDDEAESPALYISLLSPNLPQPTPLAVEKRFFLGYSCWGSDYYFEGEILPAVPADYEFALKMTCLTERLLAQGKLQNHPVSVNENSSNSGGLKGILEGLDIVRNGKVSGRKLVYKM